VEQIRNLPVLGSIINIFDRYPRLSMWMVLSLGMVGLLVYEARDVGLSTGNWVALIVASVVVAGLCVWIVSWEDEADVDEPVRIQSKKKEAPVTEETVEPLDGVAVAEPADDNDNT
jgi:hypothetical protein